MADAAPNSALRLLLLIDGYNVIAPSAPPGRGPKAGRASKAGHGSKLGRGPSDRWLERERRKLIDRVADRIDDELASFTTIVFDAAHPPPGAAALTISRGMTIRFAVGYTEADDLIEELIADHHSPKRLTVVSSDRRIQRAARRRGALAVDSSVWLDELLEGKPRLAIRWPTAGTTGAPEPSPPQATQSGLSPDEVEQWMSHFGIDRSERDPDRLDLDDHPFPPHYGEDLLP